MPLGTLSTSDHIVILALDTLGDLVLRQPLFRELLERGHAVTVVTRRGYEEILPFLDRRLGSQTIDVNPHCPPDAAAWRPPAGSRSFSRESLWRLPSTAPMPTSGLRGSCHRVRA
jgi:hypothetical protein